MQTSATPDAHGDSVEYEAPALTEVGGVYELTLTGGHGNFCWHNKTWGGSDGVKFLNVIPVGSC
jgi:hypothetical protein